MSEWNNLPLLPIRCILDHLNESNALAAMSTCRQWRQAMLLYEGRRDTLRLRAKQLDKSLFVARLFRRHTQNLHVYINCSEEDLNNFMRYVLPQFFDSIKLKEVIFIGQMYIQHNAVAPLATLKRIILESLVFKNADFIERIAFLGCQLDSGNNEDDRYVHKQVEHYSERLSFGDVTSPKNTILTRSNLEMVALSKLKHVVIDFEIASTDMVETLVTAKNLKMLSFNVAYRQNIIYPYIDWHHINQSCGTRLNVAVNMIAVPTSKFKYIMDIVLQVGMNLTSLKVMYCKNLYVPLLHYVGLVYNTSLQEMVWVDCPYDGVEADRAIKGPLMSEIYEQGNPFILLCWQCLNLRRLVIHGYWLWQYDVLGLARLRELYLEVSSVFSTQTRFTRAAYVPNCALRVMLYDTPITADSEFIRDMSALQTVSWKPVQWRRLPAGLRAKASAASKGLYILNEVTHPLGIT